MRIAPSPRPVGAMFALLLVVIVATTGATARAQCTQLAPCSGGPLLTCQTPPRIGTSWTICQQNSGMSCAGYAYVFGSCQDAGIPIGGGVACSSCPRCSLHVNPVLAGVVGGGPCTTLQIPQDRNLVGTILCTQGACIGASCLCATSAVQVQIEP